MHCRPLALLTAPSRKSTQTLLEYDDDDHNSFSGFWDDLLRPYLSVLLLQRGWTSQRAHKVHWGSVMDGPCLFMEEKHSSVMCLVCFAAQCAAHVCVRLKQVKECVRWGGPVILTRATTLTLLLGRIRPSSVCVWESVADRVLKARGWSNLGREWVGHQPTSSSP